jgi:hypothetical protein
LSLTRVSATIVRQLAGAGCNERFDKKAIALLRFISTLE